MIAKSTAMIKTGEVVFILELVPDQVLSGFFVSQDGILVLISQVVKTQLNFAPRQK